MNSRFSSLILLVLAILIVNPSDVSARRKSRRHRMIEISVVEPDMLAQKAPQEGSAIESSMVDLKQVLKRNPRYREGIDVSHYQGRIDWDQVAGSEKICYVYLKATEGVSYVDDTYQRNLREAKRVGLCVGSYHFYRPNTNWREQLKNMTDNVRIKDQDLVPIVDIEHRGRVSESKFIRDLKSFVEHVERHYGKKPLLYSYQNFYNRYLKGHFTDYHWMIAKYQDDKPVLHDGKDFIIWQYTQSGRMPGVRGGVDRSCLMDGFELYQLQMLN